LLKVIDRDFALLRELVLMPFSAYACSLTVS
jgi:hypothetical protein